ncbi:MAG: hypothetical protein AAFU03_16165, partial [Bacteroidota bacterium]
AKNRLASIAFNGRIKGVNALLTFLFGCTYASGFITTGLWAVDAAIGGLVYLTFLDYAAYSWDKKVQGDNLSPEQIAIGSWMRMVCILCSTIVSACFLVLTTRLVDLSGQHEIVGMIALGVITLIAAANMWYVYEFGRQSLDSQEASLIAADQAASRKIDIQTKIDLNQIKQQEKLRMGAMIGDLVSQEINKGMRSVAKAEARKILSEWNNEWNEYEEELNETAQVSSTGSAAKPNEVTPTTPLDGEVIIVDRYENSSRDYVEGSGTGKKKATPSTVKDQVVDNSEKRPKSIDFELDLSPTKGRGLKDGGKRDEKVKAKRGK